MIELDRKVGEAIDIYVNNRLVARGEVVVVDERLGVTMTEIIKDGDAQPETLADATETPCVCSSSARSDGQISAATKIAMDHGAKVAHVDTDRAGDRRAARRARRRSADGRRAPRHRRA